MIGTGAYNEAPQEEWALEDSWQSFLPSAFGEMCDSVCNGLENDNAAKPAMQQIVRIE